MKMSVSLPGEDVDFLDAYADAHQLQSRSAAVQRAVHALRVSELAQAYGPAWAEWQDGDDASLWSATVSDGL